MFKEYQTGGTTQQSPLEMLAQNYGLSLQELLGMAAQERATYMGSRYGISDQSLLQPELFSGVNQDLISQMQSTTYDPMIAGQQGNLINELLKSQRGIKSGNFAGSYQPSVQMTGLYDVYGKSMGNIFGDIAGKQQAAQTEIANIISGYGTTASGLRG